MKKLVFALVAVATFAFASCAGEKADNVEADANALVEELKANVANPEKVAALVEQAQTKLAELTEAGDTAAVNKFKEIFNNVINGDTTVKEAVQQAVAAAGGETISNFLNNLTGAGVDAACCATDDAKEAVEGAVADVKDAAANAKEEVKEAGKEIVENAKEATKEAVKEKAAEGVEKGLKKLGL
ncbi:MAG: hypothetical protein IJ816_02965 [Alloprevotella sp.]|nr:hypothetical protein [Alloprevotella sp.]